MPVECALLPEIDVSNQQNGYIQHHFDEAEPPHCGVVNQILENVCPRIEEYGLDVEQDEDHLHEIKLHRERLAGISRGCYATLVGLQLGLVWTAPSDERGNSQQCPCQYHVDQHVY